MQEDMSQVIRTAIKLETDGIEFYKGAADKTSHPFGKRMFLSLMKDEERHLKILKEVLDDLDFSDFEKYFKETPMQKIKTVFDELKGEMNERIAANPSEMEVLKMGMKVEDESVNFYRDSLEKTTDKGARALLNKLVMEERDHYRILQNTYSYLEDSGKWFLWEEKGILDGG